MTQAVPDPGLAPVPEAPPPPDDRQIELLAFHLGGQEYSVDIMSVREIRGWSKPTPLPHAPGYLRGVINLRGTVLPIMDLSERLGLGRREASGRDVIIVIEAEGRTIGLLVSAVSDILTVPTDALDAPPDLTGEDGARFLLAIALHGNCLTRVLDLSAVLPPVKSALI